MLAQESECYNCDDVNLVLNFHIKTFKLLLHWNQYFIIFFFFFFLLISAIEKLIKISRNVEMIMKITHIFKSIFTQLSVQI